MARWQSGYAAACKAVYAGSIPTSASTTSPAVAAPAVATSRTTARPAIAPARPRSPTYNGWSPPRAAARVADHIGSDHYQLIFTAEDLARAVESMTTLNASAAAHAAELGVAVDALIDSGVAWVLSRLDLRMEGWPRGDEEIVVHSLNGVIWAFHHDGTEVRDGDSNPATVGVFFDRDGAEVGFTVPELSVWGIAVIHLEG